MIQQRFSVKESSLKQIIMSKVQYQTKKIQQIRPPQLNVLGSAM